eukprot:6056466-Prymnesium_polylepis.1
MYPALSARGCLWPPGCALLLTRMFFGAFLPHGRTASSARRKTETTSRSMAGSTTTHDSTTAAPVPHGPALAAT